MKAFINFFLIMGSLLIIAGILQFVTGYYTTGKFGPIYPGELGPFLSLLEILVGITFLIYGIKKGLKK